MVTTNEILTLTEADIKAASADGIKTMLLESDRSDLTKLSDNIKSSLIKKLGLGKIKQAQQIAEICQVSMSNVLQVKAGKYSNYKVSKEYTELLLKTVHL